MGSNIKKLLHSRGFALALFTYASASIWFYSVLVIVEAPIFAAFLPDTAKMGCYLYFVKGISSFAVILVPLFTRKGKSKLFMCSPNVFFLEKDFFQHSSIMKMERCFQTLISTFLPQTTWTRKHWSKI